MRKIKNIHQLLFLVVVFAALVVGCDDPYKTIDYRKLEAEERALLQEYLDKELDNLKAGATWYKHNEDNGLHYFQIEKGTGDSILPGNIVGYRFYYYELARNDKGEPTLYPWSSNAAETEPFFYQVGTPYSVATKGVDEGIKYMNHLGKSKMIVPSSIGTNSFFTIVAEIEITYLVNR